MVSMKLNYFVAYSLFHCANNPMLHREHYVCCTMYEQDDDTAATSCFRVHSSCQSCYGRMPKVHLVFVFIPAANLVMDEFSCQRDECQRDEFKSQSDEFNSQLDKFICQQDEFICQWDEVNCQKDEFNCQNL